MFRFVRRFAELATVAEVERLSAELRESEAALAVAEVENRYLWALAEREQARLDGETAVLQRHRAEVESTPADDDMPAF